MHALGGREGFATCVVGGGQGLKHGMQRARPLRDGENVRAEHDQSQRRHRRSLQLPCSMSCAARMSSHNTAPGEGSVETRGVYLERLTWLEAAECFDRDPLIVLPVGAAAKEHGPHLPLGTDHILANTLAARLAERVPCLVAPTVTYGYYPSFADFPGTTHLEAATFGGMVREIVASLHRHGPRRFLILNTGVSTFPVLEIAARDLRRNQTLLVGVTRIEDLARPAFEGLLEQPAGSHADEYETSVVLAIAPDMVRQERAVREIPERPNVRGLFIPSPLRAPAQSTSEPRSDEGGSGVYGDPTLATAEKGERILAAVVAALVAAAEYLRTAPVG
jgi:creatinine amidohydrolase